VTTHRINRRRLLAGGGGLVGLAVLGACTSRGIATVGPDSRLSLPRRRAAARPGDGC